MSAENITALRAFDELAAARTLREDVNCQWRVAARPIGNVKPTDFVWTEGPIPEPGEGEVLLKTLYIGLRPAMRYCMQGIGVAGEEALRLGDVIQGRGVAEVVASRRNDVQVGEVWQGPIGWQSYKTTAMAQEEGFFRVRHADLSTALSCSVLGMTGLSAHAGFFACGLPRPGHKVLVSGAAGGVGSLVVQLAQIAGCEVVGIAGGADKCAFVRNLGAKATIDYQRDDVPTAIAELFPNGIDIFFDIVGGEILSASLENLAMKATVVLCGSVAEHTRGEPFALTNYAAVRRVDASLQGFFVDNHIDRFEPVMDELAGWIRDGSLNPVQDIVHGLPSMPRALATAYYGGSIGVQCCRVRDHCELGRANL